MPRTLKPEEFCIISGENTIPGTEVIKAFKFDPSLCKIEVDEHGMLHISQPGKVLGGGFHAAPEFWGEVKAA